MKGAGENIEVNVENMRVDDIGLLSVREDRVDKESLIVSDQKGKPRYLYC